MPCKEKCLQCGAQFFAQARALFPLVIFGLCDLKRVFRNLLAPNALRKPATWVALHFPVLRVCTGCPGFSCHSCGAMIPVALAFGGTTSWVT